MWNDWFTIGKLTIHGYGVCIAVGFLCALLLASHRAKKRGLSEDACYGLTFCAVIFGILGAKLMFLIVEWKAFIANPKEVLSTSGFVVFGGLTLGILSAVFYCRAKKLSFWTYMDLICPSIALGQAFGRLGCFCAGCCYGKPTDSWLGITFHNSHYAPNGVKLLPSQLISSGANVLHMIVLLLIAKKAEKSGKKGVVTGFFMIFYSVGRFFIEMLRADDRGEVGKFSTSQFYGFIIAAFGIGVVIWALTHKEKEVSEAIVDNNEKTEGSEA